MLSLTLEDGQNRCKRKKNHDFDDVKNAKHARKRNSELNVNTEHRQRPKINVPVPSDIARNFLYVLCAHPKLWRLKQLGSKRTREIADKGQRGMVKWSPMTEFLINAFRSGEAFRIIRISHTCTRIHSHPHQFGIGYFLSHFGRLPQNLLLFINICKKIPFFFSKCLFVLSCHRAMVKVIWVGFVCTVVDFLMEPLALYLDVPIYLHCICGICG